MICVSSSFLSFVVSNLLLILTDEITVTFGLIESVLLNVGFKTSEAFSPEHFGCC